MIEPATVHVPGGRVSDRAAGPGDKFKRTLVVIFRTLIQTGSACDLQN